MSERQRELYTVQIPDEVMSRGTGEEVPLKEITAFDVMPQLIGSEFLTNDALRSRMHFHGDHFGPFLAQECAYMQLAEVELASRGLTQAIDAYRRSVHYAIEWVSTVAVFGWPDGSRLLLTKEQVERMDLGKRFGSIENRIAARLWAGEVAFHPDEYTDFVKEIRRLEKRRFQLHQLFFFGSSTAFEPVKADGKNDPDIGREYIDTCVAMNRFKEAAWIARELGWKEEEVSLTEKAKDVPKDNPRAESLIESERSRFDRG